MLHENYTISQMEPQINDFIDVLTRLSKDAFSQLTYDPNDDALRFLTY